MLKITIEGKDLQDLHNNVAALAAEIAGEQQDAPKAEPQSKASKTTPKEPEATTATVSKDSRTLEDGETEHDGVIYGPDATKRNLWIMLTDGRVIFIQAGGRLPAADQREKNISKTIFNEIAEDDPTRVAKSIAEAIDEDLKEEKKAPAKKKDPEPKTKAVDPEPDEEPEEIDDEPEEDEEEQDLQAQAKELVRAAKKLEGGKAFVKELLDDYDIKRPTEIEDESDLEDFIEELGEFIEDNE